MLNTNRTIQISANVIALTLFAAAIGCGRGNNPQAQLALLAGALPISFVASYHGHLADKVEPYARMRDAACIEAYASQLTAAIEIPTLPMPAPMLPAASSQLGESEAIATTPLESVLSMKTGICLFGNSGAGKSSVIQWLLGEAQPDSLVILDPDNDGVTWGNLPVIDDYDAILDKLADLLEDLKQRRDRRKKGLPNPPVMIVAEEWPDVRAWAKKRKNDVCDEFVQRMGCGARKQNMVTLLCSQSGNVKSMGLDGQGDFLHNWCLVRLGEIAKKYAKNMPDRLVAKTVAKSAYPCLINDELSHHPTHGHYPAFKDGQHPQNIKPYRNKQNANKPSQPDSNLPKIETDVIRNYLNRLYNLPGYSPPETHPADISEINPETEKRNDSETAEKLTPKSISEFGEISETTDKGAESGGKSPRNETEMGEAALVLKLKNSGKNQTQIIFELWGAKPGSNSNYAEALAKFRAIKAYWESLNLWN